MSYFVMVREHDSVRAFVPYASTRHYKLGAMAVERYYGPYTLAGARRVQRRAVASFADIHAVHGAQPADGTAALWGADGSTGGVYAEIRTYAPYGAHRNMPRDAQ